MIAPTYAELRRLLAEATPGPWSANAWYGEDGGWCAVGPLHEFEKEDEGGPDGYSQDEPGSPPHQRAKRDGELIAAMRNALPALLTEAEAGRKLRGRMDSIHAGHVWSSRETAKFALAEYDAAVAKGGAE